jgi:hypothetical protein
VSNRSSSLSHVVVAASAVLGIGGAAFLASLPSDSVGRTQLKDDAVNSARVQDKTLTGKDIQSNTLGTVPKAKSAKAANSAKVADSAKVAGTAYTTANKAGGHVTAVIPAAPTTFASLTVPAGSYVISAKAQIDSPQGQDIVGCDLVAGQSTDTTFVQGSYASTVGTPTAGGTQVMANSLVSILPTGGVIELKCAKGSAETFPSISQIRLTAVSVGTIVSQP